MRLFKRSYLRISLRVSLLLFVAAGFSFGWLARHLDEHRKEQQAIAAIDASLPFNGNSWQTPISGVALPIFQ